MPERLSQRCGGEAKASWDSSGLHVDDLLPRGRLNTMRHAAFSHTGTNAAQTNPQAHADEHTTTWTAMQKLMRTDKTHFS